MLQRFFFNFWYFHRPPWDSGIVPPELENLLQSLPPGRALDLGCGSGTSSIAMAQRGWRVTAVDYAWRAIRIARQKARRAGVHVEFYISDVIRLKDISGPFNLVVDIGCFHSLSPTGKQDYITQLNALLAPGGHWFLYTFLRPNPAAQSGTGTCPADLDRIQACCALISRQDGFDGQRPSVYFLFQK